MQGDVTLSEPYRERNRGSRRSRVGNPFCRGERQIFKFYNGKSVIIAQFYEEESRLSVILDWYNHCGSPNKQIFKLMKCSTN